MVDLMNSGDSRKQSARILVVDDEPDITSLLASLLTQEGYRVKTASNGKEGVDCFLALNPDLVITDIRMPVQSGLELLKNIREHTSDIDVIILTGHGDHATAIEALRHGAFDYFLKPLDDVEQLIDAVEKALTKLEKLRLGRMQMERLEEMAIRDALTGLFNRRQFDIAFEGELQRGERYGRSFCLLIVDIDHFKSVNDTFGHLFGDFVLQELGRVLSDVIRETDTLYRYGGEEFCVLMPETHYAEGKQAALRLLEAARKHVFNKDGQSLKLTISIGGAVFPDCPGESLIQTADQALYQAKQDGRNRVVFREGGS